MLGFIVHQGLDLPGSNQPRQLWLFTQHHEELFVMCQALCRMEDWWKNITSFLQKFTNELRTEEKYTNN